MTYAVQVSWSRWSDVVTGDSEDVDPAGVHRLHRPDVRQADLSRVDGGVTRHDRRVRLAGHAEDGRADHVESEPAPQLARAGPHPGLQRAVDGGGSTAGAHRLAAQDAAGERERAAFADEPDTLAD